MNITNLLSALFAGMIKKDGAWKWAKTFDPPWYIIPIQKELVRAKERKNSPVAEKSDMITPPLETIIEQDLEKAKKGPPLKNPRNTFSAVSQAKRKKSQLIGYFLCWVCMPIFLFGAAFCDHGNYCAVAQIFAWLIILGCIPLIIGQVILYRSKLSFPPLDAFVFLGAALCELTFVLFPLGVVLWAIGIIIEILLLLYILIRTMQEAPSQEYVDEKIIVRELEQPSQPLSSSIITPLLQAVMEGALEKAKEVLADNTEQLNTAYAPNGNTPLHVAALNGHTDIVRLLLAQPGIDTTRSNNAGQTALDLAREKGFEEIALLLENR